MIAAVLSLLRGPDIRRLRERNLALQLDVRRLEADLAHQRRLTAGANAAAERAYIERDRANAQATSWLRIAGDQSEALIRQGAARERLTVVPPVPEPSRPVVVPFGRRKSSPVLPVA